MVGTCTKASLQAWLQWHIYDYSFEEDELSDAHIGAIVCFSFCCMTMNEQLMMFKHIESNCIGHKSLFCCASKPSIKNLKTN
jgi:hypothetical protein